MPGLRPLVAASLGPILCAACGSTSAGGGDLRGDVLIPVCAWPAAADSFDPASGTGCLPRSMSQICAVPSGSVVHADGSITTPDGETVTCVNACSPAEYSLACHGSSLPGTIPDPDPSLACRVVPVPTPPDSLFHCCPCAP